MWPIVCRRWMDGTADTERLEGAEAKCVLCVLCVCGRAASSIQCLLDCLARVYAVEAGGGATGGRGDHFLFDN